MLRKQLAQLEPVWDAKRNRKAKKDEDEEYWSDRRDALGPIREEVEYQLSAKLIAQAQRYEVPIPAFVDDGGPWTESEYISPYYLNEIARAELRSAIRKEQKERSEILRTWLTVVLSVIGAVCGVAALLLRK
ncbi:MAG: hypothetical protein K2Z81_14020 [Cyanobacteria bacterium]|nr:hypothetical protein [Cyanobacteriota bacterium]